MIKLIKKYEEEFNDESNEDDINEELTTDEIENKLDSKIPKYNKYDKNHPMQGVTFNEKNNNFRLQYKNYDSNATNFTTACEKIKEKITPKNQEKILKKCGKNYFTYMDHFFITYWKNNDPLFDIQHIISVLNLKPSYIKEKYNEFSDKIIYYMWHKNEYDGYILRELIDEKSMYELILSSNSKFSKSFKTDIAQILVQLRKENKLQITNNKIQLKTNNSNKFAIQFSTKIIHQQTNVYNYNSFDNLSSLEMLIV